MLLKVVAFVAPLGLDTLALAIALGLRGVTPLRPALVFAVFEGLVPLAGVLVGTFVSQRFASIATITGAVILIGLGIHTFREAGEVDEEAEKLDFTSLRTAAAAGLAISIDELAVGFPLASEHLPIFPILAALALQAFALGYIGIRLGRKLGAVSARRSQLFAAVAFVALGGWLIVEHFVVR